MGEGESHEYQLVQNPYLQYDRHLIAASDPNILELVTGQDLVLVLDKKNELITFCASKAVQKLFSKGALDNIYTCFDIWNLPPGYFQT